MNTRQIALMLVLAIAALVTGCKTTRIEYTAKDGAKVVATDRRLFMSTAAEITTGFAPDGTPLVTIKAKSDPAAQALADGLKMGLELGKSLAK